MIIIQSEGQTLFITPSLLSSHYTREASSRQVPLSRLVAPERFELSNHRLERRKFTNYIKEPKQVGAYQIAESPIWGYWNRTSFTTSVPNEGIEPPSSPCKSVVLAIIRIGQTSCSGRIRTFIFSLNRRTHDLCATEQYLNLFLLLPTRAEGNRTSSQVS